MKYSFAPADILLEYLDKYGGALLFIALETILADS